MTRSLNNNILLSIFYLIGYIILLIASMIEEVNVTNDILRPIMIVSVSLGVLINIIVLIFNRSSHYVLKSSIFICIVAIFSLEYILKINIMPIRLAILLLLLLNANVINLRKFLHVDLIFKVMVFGIIGILSYLNIIHNITNSKGYSFGFTNSNIAGGIILSIVMSLLMILDNSIRMNSSKVIINKHFKNILWISLIIILLFGYLTKCRGLLFSGIFCLIFISLYNIDILYDFICKHTMIITVFILLIVLWLVYSFSISNPFWDKINNLFSGRLLMQSLIIKYEPLKFIGQPIHQYLINGVGVDLSYYNIPFLTVDNSYLAIAYHYGLIGLFLVELTFLSISKFASKYKEYVPCVLLISLAFYAGIEGSFLSVFLISPLLYCIAIKHVKRGD